MSVIRVTATTMGQGNPALAGVPKPYRYKGDPGWMPGDPRYREDAPRNGQAAASAGAMRARQARFAEFCRHRGEGVSVAEAGRLTGVAVTTARTYERERKEQQRGEADG